MSRTLRFLLALTLILISSKVLSAQATTGTPPFGSTVGGTFDTVDLANLNVHFTIPVVNKAGRGVPFNYNLQYDTSTWYPVGTSGNQTWTPIINWGLLAQTAVTTGELNASFSSNICMTYIYLNHTWVQTGEYFTYYWTSYVDPWGISHPINATSTGGWGTCGGAPVTISDINVTTPDGSGFTLKTQNAAYSDSVTITTKDGTVTHPPISSNAVSSTYTDRNGNQISVDSSGHFTDTLGQPALAISGSGTPTIPMLLTYSAPGSSGTGVGASVTINYKSYTVATNFGISTIHEYGSRAVSLVDNITLADGSKYVFAYEATPSVPSNGACSPLSGTYSTNCVTARLASITLPTGGAINYTYTNGNMTSPAANNGIVAADGSTPGLTRQTPDGTWTYARSQVSGAHYQTTVNDPTTPTANQTIIDFQGLYETKRVTYQGSSSGTLLQTVNTCYNGAASPCTTIAVTLPITRRTQLVAYPDNTGKVCEHDQYFNTYGLQTEQDDYDYGSGAPASTPLRKVITVYNTALTNGIVGMPSSVTTCNGTGTSSACTGPSGSSTGTVVAQSTFAYDETTPTTSNPVSPQWTSITGSRGNATTIKALVSGTTFLTQTISYYDTGNLNVATDVNGGTTTYNYAGTSCGNAFPTGITEAISTLTQSYTWNCVGGVQLTAKDENSQITTTAYTDPYFWRPASVSLPDGGLTSWTYNSQTSVTTTAKMNSSQNIVKTQLLDGLGRNKEQQLNSDPQGVVYQDTTYDALGRVYSVSNPYRSTSDPTYGLTTNRYDALSRPTSVTLQDGSVSNASYTNNTTTATDPAGKKRTITFDSLGRLIQVTEDPGGLGYVTSYSNDALGDLTGVTQNGRAQRTYVYDALTRLTSETNPESGTTTYGYDASGHSGDLTSRVAPAPNQTGSSTVTTTYTYDLFHRLTQKSYSDGTTPTATYTYDLATPWGSNYGGSYKGRLNEADTSNSHGLVASSIFVYDPMGRVTMNGKCTPTNCPSPYSGFHTSYTYDFAGNLTSYGTSENGITFGYQYNTAARPTTVTSSLIDSQHPATLASGLSYMPAAAYTQMTLGNGLLESRAYNNRLQPTEIKSYYSSGFVRYDFTYGFTDSNGHNNGNLVSWNSSGSDFAFNRSYTSDSLNRLATMGDSASGQTCKGLSWTYDAWGNRTDQSITNGSCPTFHQTVNTQNRLVGPPYQYDSAGNMTADASHTYSYDAENRLLSVDGGSTATYAYDALGQRVQKTVGSAITQYVHGLNAQVILETDGNGNGNPTADYIYLAGNLVAEYKNSTTYFAQSDHLGSTRLLTGVDGSGQQSWDYLPFGEVLLGVPVTTHLFTGDEQDAETALAHTLFRQYASSMGRWMTPDPAGLAAVDPTNPQSWNRYAYVLNNPLNLIDRYGLDCVYLNDAGDGVEYVDSNSDEGGCQGTGGFWANGYVPNDNGQILFQGSVVEDPNSDRVVIYTILNGQGAISLAGPGWTQGAYYWYENNVGLTVAFGDFNQWIGNPNTNSKFLNALGNRPITFSVMIPILGPLGPTFTGAIIPAQNYGCGGAGVGLGTPGADIDYMLGSTGNPKDILSGPSTTFSGYSPNGPGGAVSTNDSGTMLSGGMGTPGVSLSRTHSWCGTLAPGS